MRCTHTKLSGGQCNSTAISGSQFCFWHDPSVDEEKRQQARANGGKSNKIEVQNPLPPMQMKTSGDVAALLGDTINAVRAGELDLKIANCIGYLSGHLIRAIEVSEIEIRVEIIEKAIFKR